jgi:predicted CoA-substrate-specific enzyme activase
MNALRADWLAIDVGSTTVKAVVSDAAFRVTRSAYHRHHGNLARTVATVIDALVDKARPVRAVLTGSGARIVAEGLDAPVVHEVAAVAAAVEALHPRARGAFELGGQDSKAVWFDRDRRGLVRRAGSSMNDRCAAGTGVTIERCLLRLGISSDRLASVRYEPDRVRPLSSKCGVFAETDAVNLARSGVPAEDLIVSLADAIVLGNLAVLVRGVPLEPDVVLLGGPVVFFPAIAGAFRHHLLRLRRERDRNAADTPDSVIVPPDALLYAALGTPRVAAGREPVTPRSRDALLDAMDRRSPGSLRAAHQECIVEDSSGVGHEGEGTRRTVANPAATAIGPLVLGIDAGSTVSKAVVVDADGSIVARASQRSTDPVVNARSLREEIDRQLSFAAPGRSIERIGVTGYGAGVTAAILGAEVTVLETVAHAAAARAVFPDADVVCDIGGQDIKVLVLDARGTIRDFRISSQCSAGIGMVLETTAREFGIALDEYARRAFSATRAPRFDESCVVFLDSNRVQFQRDGYTPDEILNGLAMAVPRVVWSHVAGGVRAAALGRTFVLQGGVQRNAAAVKAQFDYLRSVRPDARVHVHPEAAYAGAMGAAIVARRADVVAVASHSLPVAVSLRSDESTRCDLCTNRCARSLVEVTDADGATAVRVAGNGCEAGGLVGVTSEVAKRIPIARARTVPNLLGEEARLLFARDRDIRVIHATARRVRVGVPRTLAMYRAAPFFRAYLQALGVKPHDVVFSPPTSSGLFRAGAHHGATDPCFPVKLVLSHVHYLLESVHRAGQPLDAILIPRVTHASTPVRHVVDCASCPVVAASPAIVRAAFSNGRTCSEKPGVRWIDTAVDLARPDVLGPQMFAAFEGLLGVTRGESDVAVDEGLAAMRRLDSTLQSRGRDVLREMDRDRQKQRPRRGAVLVIGRPYHADPGVSHHIGEEIQALGFPVLTIRSLPRDERSLDALFGKRIDSGAIEDGYDIRDLFHESENSGSSERLWAARYASSHGSLGVVDISSFKCAQDAPTLAPMNALFDASDAVVCRLHELDETRPTISLRLRLETFVNAMREKGLHPWPSSSAA